MNGTVPTIPSMRSLRIVAERIGRETGCDLVVLFGPAGRGEAEAQDVDIGVRASEPLLLTALEQQFAKELAFDRIEVTDLRQADPHVLMAVVRDGVPLFQSEPTAFSRFASLAARRYADVESGPRGASSERPSLFDPDTVRRKLELIGTDVTDLERFAALSLEGYRGHRLRKKAAERLMQEVVEAAVDVNLHLLRAADPTLRPDYFASFSELGQNGLLPQDLADRLATCTELRNRLVHEYDELDDDVVYQAICSAGPDFKAYIGHVETFLSTRGV